MLCISFRPFSENFEVSQMSHILVSDVRGWEIRIMIVPCCSPIMTYYLDDRM